MRSFISHSSVSSSRAVTECFVVRFFSSLSFDGNENGEADSMQTHDSVSRPDEAKLLPQHSPAASPHTSSLVKPPMRRKRPKFSFLSDPHELTALDAVSHDLVPNNTPKPLLPMWSSSLTSPRLEKQRLVVENWISMDSTSVLSDAMVRSFNEWLRDRIGPHAARQLERHVDFHLGARYARGLVARRAFSPGETIFSLPLASAEGKWGLLLNAEQLERHSLAARRRHAPLRSVVSSVVSQRRSYLDPTPHPLFIEQFYCAVLLACERADGERSPLYPYLQLMAPFDDDFIREVHVDVLEPPTLLEYADHRGRFEHYLRQIHKNWSSTHSQANPTKTEHVPNETHSEWESPPSMEDLKWALRVVLSRQRLLPLRGAALTDEMALRSDRPLWRAFGALCGVVDQHRLHSDRFDPKTIASVMPLVCMLRHPPGGVSNTSLHVSEDGSEVAVRAVCDVEEGDELTLLLSRCYSVSYTLYRFGFLPLRRREDDAADDAMGGIGVAMETSFTPHVDGKK